MILNPLLTINTLISYSMVHNTAAQKLYDIEISLFSLQIVEKIGLTFFAFLFLYRDAQASCISNKKMAI